MAVRTPSPERGPGRGLKARLPGEEGQVLVWMLILLPLLLLMAGILIEGGLMYRTYRLAHLAADAGAHAAAQEIDTARYLRTGRVALTPPAAGIAQAIAAANLRGEIACAQPQVWAGRVDLVCRATLRPVLLWDSPRVQVAVRGSACPAWGISAEGQ